jgi:glycosyltransferase involved in cell wall biosynthesis
LEYALTTYPLSAAFKRRFEQSFGSQPTYIDYTELRQLPPLKLLQRLRTLRASKLFLPVEDEASRCLLPFLKGLAAVTDASAIKIVGPDLLVENVARWSVGGAIADLAAASIASASDKAACEAEVAALLQLPLSPGRLGQGKRALYIKGNVLFGLKAGGSIGHVAGVVNALSAGGHDVTLASTEPPTMIADAVRTVLLKTPRVFGLPFERSQYTLHRMMVRQLEQESADRPNFIYQRMSPANYAGVTLARRWGVPLVIEYNGSEVWIASNWRRSFRYPELALGVENVCLRHADLVVTVSDVLANELVERGVPKERIVWYPNCVDTKIFDPANYRDEDARRLRKTLDIPEGAPVVTFIGTFGQWHGVEVFARAIRRLADQHRAWLESSGVRFLLVGDGPKMPEVRQILAGEAYAPFVRLTGLVPQADAPKYLALSDVVASPHVANADGSRFFGSPTKLFEYMAMGKAIVASDLEQIGAVLAQSVRTGALPSQAPADDERRLAVLCPPGDDESLTAALRFVVEQPAWRQALGRNARREALAKYSWARHVAAILEGLESVSRESSHA